MDSREERSRSGPPPDRPDPTSESKVGSTLDLTWIAPSILNRRRKVSNPCSNRRSTPCVCALDDPHLNVRRWWAHWTIHVVESPGTTTITHCWSLHYLRLFHHQHTSKKGELRYSSRSRFWRKSKSLKPKRFYYFVETTLSIQFLLNASGSSTNCCVLLKGRIVTCLRLQGLLCSLWMFQSLILLGWCSSLCSLSHQSYVLKSTRFPYTRRKKKTVPPFHTLQNFAWEDGLLNEDVLYSLARPSLSNRSMCAFQTNGLTKSGLEEWYY